MTYAANSVVRRFEKKKNQPEKKAPPCRTCRPDLQAENELACSVYLRCRSSWNADSGSLVGIKNTDIDCAMDWCGIDRAERLELVDDLLLIIDTIKKEIATERERNQETRDQCQN